VGQLNFTKYNAKREFAVKKIVFVLFYTS
jgi:hypothetical protein